MTERLPIVRQLQAEAIDPNVPVTKLLRLAKVIATKLDQKDAVVWINAELDGYMRATTKDLPAYRMLTGQPKGHNPYHGWQSIQFTDGETARQFSQAPLGQSIGSLEKDLGKDRRGTIAFPYPPEIATMLREAIHSPFEVTLFLSEGTLWAVVEAVRDLVLNWSLELEKAGILGEEMTFTAKEKEEAGAVTQQFFIQNVGVLGDVSGNANVKNTQTATATLDVGEVARFAAEALGSLGQIPKGLKQRLEPVLVDIRKETAREKPEQSKLRELMISARTIAEEAAGSLAASGIVAMIGKILGA